MTPLELEYQQGTATKGKTMSMGKYYVTALRDRTSKFGDTRRYGDQVGRQIKTSRAAMAILDRLDEPGYVQCWSDSTQQRYITAERDAAGVWSAINPYTGKRETLLATA